MKYSLRSLMVVVTLTGVVLGGRIEYLRRWAVFHEREALRYAQEWERLTGWNPAIPGRSASDFELLGVPFHPLDQFETHQQIASYYRAAMHHPWQFADPPVDKFP